jgi:hypothetical protein
VDSRHSLMHAALTHFHIKVAKVAEYKPEDAHRQFEAAFNAGDLEALLDLY